MRQGLVIMVAVAAMLTGFYISARHYAEPLEVSFLSKSDDLIGSLRPDFNLESNSGESVSTADFSGKTILINFWATWCEPCREEMPMLMDLQRNYGPNGLQVVGIALDNTQSVRNFVKTYGITYPILIGEADVLATSAAYGNTQGVLPYSVLVDRDGIIRWQYAGVIKQEKISSLLSELL